MDTTQNHEHGETKKKSTPHVLVLAHQARGHLVPAFYLSMALARGGVMVSFVSFETETFPLISKHKEELRTLELLRFLTLPRPEAPPDPSSNTIGPDMLHVSFKDLKIREKLFASSDPPTCIIATIFLSWAVELASELQLPRYTLFGSGGILVRWSQALRDLYAQGQLRNTEDNQLEKFDGQINIAGLPPMGFADFPPIIVRNPSFYNDFVKTRIWDAHGVVVNSFHDLEAEPIDALRKFTTVPGQNFYAVGPLSPLIAPPGVVEESKHSEEPCLQWLSSQPASSVVYVCFGSGSGLNPQQINEFAIGLERSKHRFLWVLPAPDKSKEDSSKDLLPPDFEARVAGFGYVLRGWAPQLEVLSHPSTGGFLSHCGWNSTLEAISRGVPMAAFPNGAEQHMNCRYIVSSLKIAVEITRDANGIPEPNAVEGAIRQMMEEKQWQALKGRVEALRAAAAAAVAPDGSTMRERHQLAEDIKAL